MTLASNAWIELGEPTERSSRKVHQKHAEALLSQSSIQLSLAYDHALKKLLF